MLCNQLIEGGNYNKMIKYKKNIHFMNIKISKLTIEYEETVSNLKKNEIYRWFLSYYIFANPDYYIPNDLYKFINSLMHYIEMLNLTEMNIIFIYDYSIIKYEYDEDINLDIDMITSIKNIPLNRVNSKSIIPYLICLTSIIEEGTLSLDIEGFSEEEEQIEDMMDELDMKRHNLVHIIVDHMNRIDSDNELVLLCTLFTMENTLRDHDENEKQQEEDETYNDDNNMIEYTFKNRHLYYKILNSKELWKNNPKTYKLRICSKKFKDFHIDYLLFSMIRALLKYNEIDELTTLINNHLTRYSNSFDLFIKKYKRMLSIDDKEKLSYIKGNIHKKRRRIQK